MRYVGPKNSLTTALFIRFVHLVVALLFGVQSWSSNIIWKLKGVVTQSSSHQLNHSKTNEEKRRKGRSSPIGLP